VTESLLSIVLGMEAAVLVFVMLFLFGFKVLDPATAFVGGGIAVVLVGFLAGQQRHQWAVWAGGVVQVGLILLGFLTSAMFILGAAFAALWLWCFFKARSIERARAAALGGNAG